MSNRAVVQPILDRLETVRRSIRSLYVSDGIAALALRLCAFLSVTFILDWMLNIPAPVRLVFLAGGIGFLAWTAWRRVLRPLAVTISDDDLAIIVERHHPQLADRLISAIQLSRSAEYAHFNSPELVERLVQDAAVASRAVEFKDVLVSRFVARRGGLAAAFALFLAVLGAIQPAYAGIYFNRLFGGAAAWPKRVHLTVVGFTDGKLTIPRGDPLMLKVRVNVDHGSTPGRARLHYRFLDTGEEGREYMPLFSDTYTYEFPRVNGPFVFHIEAGDDETEEHTVTTDTPPTILHLNAWYTYPPYTRKPSTPSESPEQGGNIDAPLLTRVRLEAEANEPLSHYSVTILADAGPRPVKPDPVSPRKFTAEFIVTDERARYEIHLKAKNGLENRDHLVYDVRGRLDQKPEFKIHSPKGAEEFVTPVCEYPIRFTVSDDYGLKRDKEGRPVLTLQYRLSGGGEDWLSIDLKYPEIAVKESTAGAGEKVDAEYVLMLKRFDLKPNDWIVFRLVATDNKDEGGANETATKPIRFSITSIEELEKELERAVDRIKQQLVKERTAEQRNRERLRRHQQAFTEEGLNAEQRGESLVSQRNQMGISRSLLTERDNVRQVRDRGAFNKIFNEEAVHKLDLAAGELDRLATDDPNKTAVSRLAAELISRSADARSTADRNTALEDAVKLQDDVIDGITAALGLLERWATYQEVVRMMRTIVTAQSDLAKTLRKMLGAEEPTPPDDENP